MVRTGDKPWFEDRCALAHRAKQRAYRLWSRSKMQAIWEEYRVARHHAHLVSEDAKRAFTEWSKSLLMNTQNPRKWGSIVKTPVFGTSSSLPS